MKNPILLMALLTSMKIDVGIIFIIQSVTFDGSIVDHLFNVIVLILLFDIVDIDRYR